MSLINYILASNRLNRLKLYSWWLTIRSDVTEWVRQCTTCKQNRPTFRPQPSSWPASAVFERLHCDWCFVPGVGNLLVCVDATSGWIEASLKPHRTTQAVIDVLTEICCRFGVPKMLVTDNALEFVSAEMTSWCRTNGIRKLESLPYHPSSNRTAERGVQTVKACLKAWKTGVSHMSFTDYLNHILFHYRACFRRSDGKTPAEHVLRHQVRLPLTKQYLFGQQIKY